jgi:uncharacterized protein (TIGR00251 family)
VIRETPQGITVDVTVVPRAGRTGLSGIRGGRLLVRLAAPPVEGAANTALIDFFSKLFRRPKSAVRLVSGERSRTKRLAVDGVTAAEGVRVLGL